MRIVINGRFLTQRLTGVQRVASEITRSIDGLLGEGRFPGLHVRLVTEADADAAPLALRHVAVVPTGGGRGHRWEQFTLPRHVGDATLLCLGNTAPIASLLGRTRVAVMLHDQSYRLFPGDYSAAYRAFHGVLGKLLVDRAEPLFTVSAAERAVLTARNPGMRAQVIVAPNGSWMGDRAVARAAPRATLGYGLYVGSFTGRKNIASVFAAALELAARRALPFLFVGPPNAASAAFLESIRAPLRPLITFRGYVADEELPAMYRGAACLLYPSFYEASGLPPSEAMSFGCPVIASDLPVLRERCGDAALYCGRGDPASIVAAVDRLVDDPGLRDRLIARGYDQVAQFTWRKQAIGVLDALSRPSCTAD